MQQSITLAALSLLDEVQRLPEIESFDAGAFLAAAAEELADSGEDLSALGAQLDSLRAALDVVDDFARKTMGVRLNHVLVDEPVTPQFRKLLLTTVTAYAGDTQLLRSRLLQSLRLGARPVEPLVDAIVAAADRVLAQRQVLREGLLALAKGLAERALPWVRKAARDRSLPDRDRDQLRRARADLEQIAAGPQRIAAGSFEDRLKKTPLPEEEPEVEVPQGDRFALLEID